MYSPSPVSSLKKNSIYNFVIQYILNDTENVNYVPKKLSYDVKTTFSGLPAINKKNLDAS